MNLDANKQLVATATDAFFNQHDPAAVDRYVGAAYIQHSALVGDGPDALRDLINSPIYTRTQQQDAIRAIATRMELAAPLANTLALMAQNRRLFALPQLLASLQSLIADARGEVTADVVSAVALSDEQKQRLTATLAEKSGKTVKLNTRVDETLIGGMIVRLGSQMIDSSIKSKLASLQNAMKEVG